MRTLYSNESVVNEIMQLFLSRKRKAASLGWIGGAASAVICLVVASLRSLSPISISVLDHSRGQTAQSQPQAQLRRIKVFTIASISHANARQQQQDIASLQHLFEHVVLNQTQQRSFLDATGSTECGGTEIITRFDDFIRLNQPHLAAQVWQYCALYIHGGVILDSTSLLLVPLDTMLIHNGQARNTSMGVLNDKELFSNSMHGSFLYIPDSQSFVSQAMLHVLRTTTTQELFTNPLLLSQTLYHAVQQDLGNDTQYHTTSWHLLDQICHPNPLKPDITTKRYSSSIIATRIHYLCPKESGYCCHIHDRDIPAVVAITRHSLLPYQLLPLPNQLAKPYNESGSYEVEDLPYISTIRDREIRQPASARQNQSSAFDFLSSRRCLPSEECVYCLRTAFQVNACILCRKHCDCYCKTLCQIPKPNPHVGKHIFITPPEYRRDPSRLIPRIVHQTWFEEIKVDKYPYTARMVESFRQSGWEYRFYTDDMAASFLSTHFPPEVRQVYDALLPGAFKADLFRYCVLLIHGGLYADVDILLASNLDVAIDPDVGFIAPIDSLPGAAEGNRNCVWNGLMAAAPGHPFLATVIELVVNHARKRFTVVDYDHLLCPNPQSSIVHAYDILFTTGPCVLGAAVNQVLGRLGHTHMDEGELLVSEEHVVNATIPGRIIILSSNKTDLGAQHFTFWDKSLVVAGTDFPYSNDRRNPGKTHYSTVHNVGGVYGVEELYEDKERNYEEVRFYVSKQHAL